MRRLFIAVLSVVLLLTLCAGCSAQKWRYEELSFTLPAEFQNCSAEFYAADFDFLFDNGSVAIAGIQETKQALSSFGQPDSKAYTELVIQFNELSCVPLQKNGLWCFSYEAVSLGTPMTYICAIYEAQNSFWQVQAYCATTDFADNSAAMWDLILSMKTP